MCTWVHTKAKWIRRRQRNRNPTKPNAHSLFYFTYKLQSALISMDWHATHSGTYIVYSMHTCIRIVRYAKQLKSFTLSNFIWLSRTRVHPHRSSANCKCSWVFSFNHHRWLRFIFQLFVFRFSFFFGILSFVRFYIALTFASKITITVVNKSRKHDIFFTEKKEYINPFFICKQFFHIHIHHTYARKRECDGDTKQFSKICIRNWIKMQTYYSAFAINANECHIKWVQKSRVYCATME